MHNSNDPTYPCLIFGFISISAAVAFTQMGRLWVRFNGWVYRANEPKTFWLEVSIYFLIGFFSLDAAFLVPTNFHTKPISAKHL